MSIIPNTTDTWIARPKRNPDARLLLFCVPYAGGGASAFHTWPNHLPAGVEVCTLKLPARDTPFTEASFTQLDPLVEAAAPDLAPYLDRPAAFYGHSMGGTISFELVHHLAANDSLEVAHLFVGGCRALQRPDLWPPILQLPDDGFINELHNRYGTANDALNNAELVQVLLPIIRADISVCDSYAYAPRSPLACARSAFGGLRDKMVDAEDIEAWEQQTALTFSHKMFDGDHFFLQSCRDEFLRTRANELEALVSKLP